MAEILTILENIRKEINQQKNTPGGLIIGEGWYDHSKAKIRKGLIAANINRKVVATAIQEKAELIITITPPTFTDSTNGKIPAGKMELLQKLIENKIALYSLGKDWLVSEQGGFDYFLSLLDFDYRNVLAINTATFEKETILARYGERKKNIQLKDLVQLVHQHVESTFEYSGYDQTKIKGVALLSEICTNDIIYSLVKNPKIDVIIFGEITYEALNTLHLVKQPFIHLSRRVLENVILSKIERRIMEEITADLPELLLVKQEKIGTTFPSEG